MFLILLQRYHITDFFNGKTPKVSISPSFQREEFLARLFLHTTSEL